MQNKKRVWLLLIFGLMIFHFLSLKVSLSDCEKFITTQLQLELVPEAEVVSEQQMFLAVIKKKYAQILNSHVISQLFLLLLLGAYLKKPENKIHHD